MHFSWILLSVVFSFPAISLSQSQMIPMCVPANGDQSNSNSIGNLRGPKGEPGYDGIPGVDGIPGIKGQKGDPGQAVPQSFVGSSQRGRNDGGCPSITFHFPRDDQTQDYVRYRLFVPLMRKATVCAWIETDDFTDGELNTIASYATSNYYNNAYLLAFWSGTRIRTHIMGPAYDKYITGTLNTGRRVHICHRFSNSERQSDFYVNAKHVAHWSYNGATIAGGGDLLLGQEQDRVNAGGLDPAQAFSGNITNFMIWPRVLREDEIHKVAYKCICPPDYSVFMGLDRVELHGRATYSIPSSCPIPQ